MCNVTVTVTPFPCQAVNQGATRKLKNGQWRGGGEGAPFYNSGWGSGHGGWSSSRVKLQQWILGEKTMNEYWRLGHTALNGHSRFLFFSSVRLNKSANVYLVLTPPGLCLGYWHAISPFKPPRCRGRLDQGRLKSLPSHCGGPRQPPPGITMRLGRSHHKWTAETHRRSDLCASFTHG